MKKLPYGISNYEEVIEDNYYVYPTGTDIFVEPVGYRTAFSPMVKFYLDGVETVFENGNNI